MRLGNDNNLIRRLVWIRKRGFIESAYRKWMGSGLGKDGSLEKFNGNS